MAEKINIASIDIDVNEFIRSAAAAKDELKRLTDANKSLKNATGDNTQAIVQNEIEIKKQRSEYNNSIKAAQNLQTATSELSKAIDTEGKSVQQVIIDRNKLIGLSKNIKGNSEEEIALRKKLNGAIDDQTEFIRENSSEYSGSKDMIGEYKQALRGISPVMANVLDTGSQLRDGLIKQKAAMEASSVATGTTSKALRIFKLALISTGIGAIVVVLGSLIAYLKTTQAGIDAVTRVTKPLQAIFQSLLGVVQNLGKDMFEAFTNPKKLLTDLSDFVKTNLINRFKAFSVVLEGIINLDFKKVANGVIQFGSGVEDVIGKTQKLGENTSKFFGTAIEKGNKLRQIGIDIEKAEANLAINRAKITDEIRKQELISKDKSKSDAERAKSVEEALRLSKQLAEEEKSIINLKIEEEEITQSLNDSGRKDLGKLNALKAEAIDKDTEQKATELRFLGVKNQLEREGIAQTQKLKDENFQKSQQQMSEELELFLAMQGTKAKTLSEEVAIAQRVADEKTKILDAQLAAGKISQTKYNTELLLIDQELQSKKDEQKDLELKSLADFEQKKKELKDEIAIANAKSETAAAELKAEQDFEKQVSELENMQLKEEQKTELLALLTEQREQVLQDIRDSFTEAQVEKIKEANEAIIKSESETAKTREDIANVLTGALIGLLGDSLGAKLASIALEAAVQSGLVAIEGAASSGKIGANIAAANAAAIAASPLTGGLPFTAINTAQGATLQAGVKVSTKKAIGKILGASALKALGTLATSKKAKGGILEGPSHAMGGILTPFGELEGSEAVINKNSTSRFKHLLSAINVAGGGVSFGATGPTQNELINYDAMARAFGNAISAMPAPQVAVTEINEVSKNYTKVLERANI